MSLSPNDTFADCLACGDSFRLRPRKPGSHEWDGAIHEGRFCGCPKCGHVMAFSGDSLRNLHRDEVAKMEAAPWFKEFCEVRETLVGRLIG